MTTKPTISMINANRINTHPNKTIRVVAPSGAVDEHEAFDRGVRKLKALGYAVVTGTSKTRQFMRFAGSDEERVAELHEAALDSDCAIILAARGGYGVSRILSAIDWQCMAARPKIWCGHSDFTALAMGMLSHGAVQRGCRILLGPMLVHGFGNESPCEWSLSDCINAFTQPTCVEFSAGDNTQTALTDGILWGGNLSMIESVVGSPYLMPVDNGILFLEEVGEYPRKVERMLLTLLHAGILQRQNAVIWGRFTDYKLFENDRGYDMNTVKSFIAQQCPQTVFVDGLPFGHVPEKCTLAVGVSYQLSVTNGVARLSEKT